MKVEVVKDRVVDWMDFHLDVYMLLDDIKGPGDKQCALYQLTIEPKI